MLFLNEFSNKGKFHLFGGVNVLESRDFARVIVKSGVRTSGCVPV
jgi:3-deoxy-D-manno-octulosonic acid (KDO) 8-phosphate synthase